MMNIGSIMTVTLQSITDSKMFKKSLSKQCKVLLSCFNQLLPLWMWCKHLMQKFPWNNDQEYYNSSFQFLFQAGGQKNDETIETDYTLFLTHVSSSLSMTAVLITALEVKLYVWGNRVQWCDTAHQELHSFCTIHHDCNSKIFLHSWNLQ